MINENSESHPSYLALDRASLGLGAPHVQEHLEVCSQCREHVHAVARPAAGAGLAEVQRRVAVRHRAWSRLRLGVAPVAAAAAALLFWGLRPPAGEPEPSLYIGDKGFSSVWIYVRHGAQTSLWDGKTSVVAGDRLRLKVDPGRFKRVEVYSVTTPDAPELLYAGSLAPGQSVTLPDAWEVDAEPRDERLLVVFSSDKVSPSWPEWLRGKAPSGVMLLPFVLPKSGVANPHSEPAAP